MAQTSVAHRLHDQLLQIINETPPGERLPSEPYLANSLHVSRATLREAMRAFETQGIIRRKQGSGTFVNQPPQILESGLEVLESIETMAQRSGLSVDFGALNLERRVPDSDESLSLAGLQTSEVLCISRVILAEERPVAFLIDTVPAELISSEELQADFRGSILDLLLQRGQPPVLASRTEIKAVPASSRVARALGIQRGDVLLCFLAELFTTDHQIVDSSQSYFLPGYFRFHIVRRLPQNNAVLREG
jgi:GntR family transcriptional regulator